MATVKYRAFDFRKKAEVNSEI